MVQLLATLRKEVFFGKGENYWKLKFSPSLKVFIFPPPPTPRTHAHAHTHTHTHTHTKQQISIFEPNLLSLACAVISDTPKVCCLVKVTIEEKPSELQSLVMIM